MDQTHHFYKWTTLEGRSAELQDRLAAWTLAEDNARPIWADAFERFVIAVNETVDPFTDLPANKLLRAFEEALDSADHFASELRGIDTDL